MAWLLRLLLPMAARQAKRTYLPNVRFSRYFVLAYRKYTCNHRPIAFLAQVNGKVKALHFHWYPLEVAAARFPRTLHKDLSIVRAGQAHQCFLFHLRNICASITRLELFGERAHTPDKTTCIGG
jgi:hypothetical protein